MSPPSRSPKSDFDTRRHPACPARHHERLLHKVRTTTRTCRRVLRLMREQGSRHICRSLTREPRRQLQYKRLSRSTVAPCFPCFHLLSACHPPIGLLDFVRGFLHIPGLTDLTDLTRKKDNAPESGYVVFRLTANVPGTRRKSSLTDYSAGMAVSTKTGI